MAVFLGMAQPGKPPTLREMKDVIFPKWATEAAAYIANDPTEAQVIEASRVLEERQVYQAAKNNLSQGKDSIFSKPIRDKGQIKEYKNYRASEIVVDYESDIGRAALEGMADDRLKARELAEWGRKIQANELQMTDPQVQAVLNNKQAQCYGDWDLKEAYADDYEGWGREMVRPPVEGGRFFRLQCDKMDVGHAQRYCVTVEGKARLYRLVYAELPQDAREQLWNTGVYQTTWADIRSFIEHKPSGERQ